MDFFHIKRIAPPLKASLNRNIFIIAPKKVGKTSYLKDVEVDLYLDLQDSDTFRKLTFQKNIIQTILPFNAKTIAIDNIHLLPSLLEQIQTIHTQQNIHFILTATHCGFFNKILKQYPKLNFKLIELLPFCYPELREHFNLDEIIKYGSLPHLLNKDNKEFLLSNYVGLLFQENLVPNAKIRKIENFSRFLNTAALYNGLPISYEEIAKRCDVPSRTVREYFRYLKDLNIVHEIKSTSISSKNKSTVNSKFYFFDIGFCNALSDSFPNKSDYEKYEQNLKHYLLLELLAYKIHRKPDLKIEFWSNYTGDKIDFIINNEYALEVRATSNINFNHTYTLERFIKKHPLKRHLLITLDKTTKLDINNKSPAIELSYIETFVKDLWREKYF